MLWKTEGRRLVRDTVRVRAAGRAEVRAAGGRAREWRTGKRCLSSCGFLRNSVQSVVSYGGLWCLVGFFWVPCGCLVGVLWVCCRFLVGFLWVSGGHISSEFLPRLALENEEREKHCVLRRFSIPSRFNPRNIPSEFLPKKAPPQKKKQETTRHPQDHAMNAQGTARNRQGLPTTTPRATPYCKWHPSHHSCPKHVSRTQEPSKTRHPTPSHSFHLLNPPTPGLSLVTIMHPG